MSTEKELAAAYYNGLKAACCRCGGQETWDQFRQWGTTSSTGILTISR